MKAQPLVGTSYSVAIISRSPVSTKCVPFCAQLLSPKTVPSTHSIQSVMRKGQCLTILGLSFYLSRV